MYMRLKRPPLVVAAPWFGIGIRVAKHALFCVTAHTLEEKGWHSGVIFCLDLTGREWKSRKGKAHVMRVGCQGIEECIVILQEKEGKRP